MRFMVMMIPGPASRASYEQGAMPDEKTIGNMMKFNEDLVKAGVMLAGEGLHPSSKGARLSFAAGKSTLTDGPFTEVKELIGGYWLWQVKSKEEALAWAKRCPGGEGDTLEVRQVFDPSDFGPEVQAKEDALREQIEKAHPKG